MKKLLTGAIIASSILITTAVASAQVSVYVDNQNLELENQPVIENDFTLIPMRAIFEALDSKVVWVGAERAVLAFDGVNSLQITIDSPTMLLNNSEIELDVPAKIIDDHTYVPLRAVSETLGADVQWDADTKSIYITKPTTEHKAERKYAEAKISDVNNNTVMNLYYSYPSFENPDNNENISVLNSYFESNALESIEVLKTLYSDFEFSGSEPYNYYFGYEIAYDKFNMISIAEQSLINVGTELQLDYFGYFNYDFDKGSELLISDVFNFTDEDYEAVSIYDFYLYEDSAILSLNSESIAYYYEYGLAPSMGLAYTEETKELFKINLLTGEDREYQPPVSIFTSSEYNQTDNSQEPIPNVITDIKTFKSVESLDYSLGFKMTEPTNTQRYIPDHYILARSGDNNVGIGIYYDINNYSTTIRKACGDFYVSTRTGKKLNEGKVIGESYVDFYEDDETYFACFTVASDGELYSISIEMASKDLAELEILCKDIITKENK